ncbi:MAG: thioesterase [Clostridium cochlearium]|uniref:Acyl-ACP thioesterase n=1 Tax=Clostridium cochlearium TaxID=1494 RepID=A0A7Y3V970_CLOCO|nr:acyl-ACP thioesterase domain-containing protein [Clostridium cochlearium]MBE6065624.1 acyl-ACP thioesterase [Clostridium cochlearium]MDU1443859.1 thioesterase [Clostridium cochlearium]NOH15941.1 acyl-ACP thioesterase [Clostridium cochlearium]
METEKDYEIHYYEVDYKKRALITSIINYFGDIATKQSEDMSIGFKYMEENKIAWVIHKWDININSFPKYGDIIKVKTRPKYFQKFYAYRDFEIRDRNGEKIIEALSQWLLIDTDKRKLKKIPEELCKAYKVEETECKAVKMSKIKKLKNINNEKIFNVRYSDIDTNGHVNNSKYVSWIIETVPLEIVLNYTLKNLKMDYKKETVYGDKVKALCEIENKDDIIICRHSIIDKDGNELNLAETTWQKNKEAD